MRTHWLVNNIHPCVLQRRKKSETLTELQSFKIHNTDTLNLFGQKFGKMGKCSLYGGGKKKGWAHSDTCFIIEPEEVDLCWK